MTFTIGGTLATASRIWIRNLPALFVLAVICYLPALAFHAAVAHPSLAERTDAAWAWLAAIHPELAQVVGASFLFFALGSGAVCHRVLAAIDGERASIARCVGHALRRAPRIFGVTAIVYVVAMLPTSLVSVLVLGDAVTGRLMTLEAVVVAQLLELALYLPFVLAIPVVIDGAVGVRRAIARAWRLGAGARWQLAVLLGLVVTGAIVLRKVLTHQALRLSPSPIDDEGFQTHWMVFRFALLAVTLLVMTFRTAVLAVAYARLCAEREGPRSSELARVFG